jgi:hypothetical protein
MKTLFDLRLHEGLLARVNRITPETIPQWGKMNAEQMLAHLVESLRMGVGELKTASLKLPMRYTPLRQLIVYWMPWPKGSPTAPELLPANCGTLEISKAELTRLVRDFGTRADQEEWPEHPAFGRLGKRGWGALTLRHIEHHLKQFGV